MPRKGTKETKALVACCVVQLQPKFLFLLCLFVAKKNYMSLLNLTLAEARELCGTRELEIIETMPPREPRHYTPEWGDWRVVRERELENGALQLTVARELLKEHRPESPDKTR